MKKRILYILLAVLLCTTLQGSTIFSLQEYTIDGKSYVSLYDIAVKTEIQQIFDVISQRAKLFYKHNSAFFQTNHSVALINGKIYKSQYPVIRKNGEVFIPSPLFIELCRSFYSGYELTKANNYYSLSQIQQTAPTPIDIPDIKPTQPVSEKITFIIIDPGHGGKDPGAIGAKTKEKDLVLKIAAELRAYLKKELPGTKIILTRDTDRFIELATRTEIANKQLKKGENGIFVSIHINASISSRSSGYETYFLSQNASNEEARATASLENNVVVLEKRQHKPYQDVEYIEALMLTTQIQKESSALAEEIQNNMKKNMTHFKSRGVKKADFFVLRGSLMPAVLVEAGYITNASERAYLKKSSYQRTVAKSVGKGITAFVKKYNRGAIK